MRLLRFLSTYLGALKRIPGLPQIFDCLLLLASLILNPRLFRALDTIEQTVAAWPGVTVGVHRFGGIQLDVNGREIGHLHGNGILDIPFDRRTAEQALRDGRAVPHHSFAGTGWVSRPLRSDADVDAALALLRLSYERRQRV